MTNREFLEGLSDEDLAKYFNGFALKVWQLYKNDDYPNLSNDRVTQWLKAERKDG